MTDTITILRTEATKTAKLSIAIEGARSREAALSTILNMLKPELRAAAAKAAESPNNFRQDGDSYILHRQVCCADDMYGVCGDDDYSCALTDPGCPA